MIRIDFHFVFSDGSQHDVTITCESFDVCYENDRIAITTFHHDHSYGWYLTNKRDTFKVTSVKE